jgi:hypothetical protein
LNQSEEDSCAGITCKECNKINPEGSKMQYNKILLKTCHYLLIGDVIAAGEQIRMSKLSEPRVKNTIVKIV